MDGAAFNLKGPDGNRAWDSNNIDPATGASFLKLADIALGFRHKSATAKTDGQAAIRKTSKPKH